jgi:hypothetical protein
MRTHRMTLNPTWVYIASFGLDRLCHRFEEIAIYRCLVMAVVFV